MGNIAKIREISAKYQISARTLRYYEDMGLIKSIRSEDYAYRLYDEAAIQRLEHILILRRLNISVKDIKRIFSTTGSEVVLKALEMNFENIGKAVSLLQVLRETVQDFIAQISRDNFEGESNIKLLYEIARDIEAQNANMDNSGNPAILLQIK